MEGFSRKASFVTLMAIVLAVFSFIGDAIAAEAPAPSPTSGVGLGAVSPTVAAAFLFSFLAFMLGSFYR